MENVPPGDVVRVQLAVPRPVRQVADAPSHPTQGHFLGLMDDRHDQALVRQVHRDPEVDLRMHHRD